jgi:hypothetical protein
LRRAFSIVIQSRDCKNKRIASIFAVLNAVCCGKADVRAAGNALFDISWRSWRSGRRRRRIASIFAVLNAVCCGKADVRAAGNAFCFSTWRRKISSHGTFEHKYKKKEER